jgi:hypothetical protein
MQYSHEKNEMPSVFSVGVRALPLRSSAGAIAKTPPNGQQDADGGIRLV